MKILWLDTETTGLDAVRNDIITLAVIAEIDGEVKEKLYLKIQPTNWDTIEPKALEVNGLTIEELHSFDTPKVAHAKLIKFLEKYVDRYNREDKFQPAGYNVVFDINFLGEFFKKVGDKYFGSWVDYHKLDVASLVQLLALKKTLNLSSYRLESVANHYDIALDAHDAMNDIEATREVCYKILDSITVEG